MFYFCNFLTNTNFSGHRSTTGAHLALRHNKSPMAAGVTYDRYDNNQDPAYARQQAANGRQQTTAGRKHRTPGRKPLVR